MDRNIITVMSGQIVELFDRDFRELYAMSRELNLFKEFSINKRSTAASTRVTVATRPALPATSRFQVSLGDKGTLKVPAHKYHNPKYLLALGNLPEDISSPQELISKMEESLKKYPAEGNLVDEDHEVMDEQTTHTSLKGKKGTKSSCVPLKKKKFTFSRKFRQKGDDKKEVEEVVEEEPGPSATRKAIASAGANEDITEEPPAESPAPRKTKGKKEKKKKTNSPPKEDEGMSDHLLVIDLINPSYNVLR